MESTEVTRQTLSANECAADALRQNPESDSPNASAMNKAEIIAELENMVAAQLLSGQSWPADGEIISAYQGKLIRMGLLERVHDEPFNWRITPLGEELDVDLFQAFMGITWEWEMPITLEEYGLITASEGDAIFECTFEADAKTLLTEYVNERTSIIAIVEPHQNNNVYAGLNRPSTAIQTLTTN